MGDGFPQPPEDWIGDDIFETVWWRHDAHRFLPEYQRWLPYGTGCQRLCPDHLPVFGVVEEKRDE